MPAVYSKQQDFRSSTTGCACVTGYSASREQCDLYADEGQQQGHWHAFQSHVSHIDALSVTCNFSWCVIVTSHMSKLLHLLLCLC